MSVKNIWHTGDSDGEYVFFKHRMSGKLPCLKPLRAALNIGTHRGPIAFSTSELDDNLGFLFQKHHPTLSHMLCNDHPIIIYILLQYLSNTSNYSSNNYIPTRNPGNIVLVS